MSRPVAGPIALLGLLASAVAFAAPPLINATVPLGARKGVATDLSIRGANLGLQPKLSAPFGFTLTPSRTPNTDPANWNLELTVAPQTPIGVYPIRVQTEDGLSNPFLFSVGQLPQVAEKEENSAFEAAQSVGSPVVVEGQVAGNDVDYFRFPGKKGDRIVIDAQCARIGSSVDPSIRLTTAGRAFVASADDSPGLLTDARLSATLPEDGDYVIELSDSRYQGGARPVYRLVVGALPMAEEIYPIGGRFGETVGLELRGGTLPGLRTVATTVDPPPGRRDAHVRARTFEPDQPAAIGAASPFEVESLPTIEAGDLPEFREPVVPEARDSRVAVPVALHGRIDPAGDEDRFRLAVTPGQALRIEVEAAEDGSALDGVLQVIGANGAVLATADDTTIPAQGGKKGKAAGIISPDPSLDFSVPAGLTEITLALRDLQSRGGIGFPYRIKVEPAIPTFELVLADSQVSIPKNGTAAVGFTVIRKGYNGPIALTVEDPPAGLSARPGAVAEGQAVGALTFSAAPDANFGVAFLKLVGQGQAPQGPIRVAGSKHLVFAQQGTLPTMTLSQYGLAAAPSLTTSIRLDSPATPVEVVQGYGASVPVGVVRSSGADAALAVTPLPLPPGLTVPAATIPEKANAGSVAINAAAEVPLGTFSIALVAKGKVANAEQTFAIPSVTLAIVRPAALELAQPAIEVKAGTTFTLKGKVLRKAPFKEPITLKVNGLPAGLKADPVAVAAGQSDVSLAIVADAKAAVAAANANVSMSFQVNKKDYVTPPASITIKVLPAK